MRRRYRFLRKVIGCDILTAAFIAILNEFSDLPSNQVGLLTWIETMPKEPK